LPASSPDVTVAAVHVETVERTASRRPAVDGKTAIQRVVSAYDSLIVKSYSRARFLILRQRFLNEIGQYLPDEGRVLDVGCGFGLFALYYAQLHPKLEIKGFDLNAERVAMATRAAVLLGIDNVTFQVQDATTLQASGERFDAVYMLDVVHHVPLRTVRPLLTELRDSLHPGGRLLVKDLDTEPRWQRWFSHALDLAMAPKTPPHYWSAADVRELLGDLDFDVKQHAMVDILPYPHMLYVATLRG
jgi:2-polyprenyl-3-methyl-5-hydroxy-6-metoxy-1,4-benzoquinol methylase